MHNNNFYQIFFNKFCTCDVFTPFLSIYLILNGNSIPASCVHVRIFSFLSINSSDFAIVDSETELCTSFDISSKGNNFDVDKYYYA